MKNVSMKANFKKRPEHAAAHKVKKAGQDFKSSGSLPSDVNTN